MRPVRILGFALALAWAGLVSAQWVWTGPDGRRVFSDTPPPPGTPESSILGRPGPQTASPPQPAVASPAPPAGGARPPASAASLARPGGRDPELEARRQKAENAEAQKRKAEAEALARQKAENCTVAKQGIATLDTGVRLVRANDKGEPEVLDDAARDAERRRLQAIMASDCAN